MPLLRIGNALGIRISVHWTWPLSLALIAATSAIWLLPRTYPNWQTWTYWAIALGSAVLFGASFVIHEFAHSLMSNRGGTPVRSFTLYPFGGISSAQEQAPSPPAELLIVVAGPLANIVLGTAAAFLAALTREGPLATLLVFLAVFNLLFGLLNLVPGFPFDGGRLLRALLWFLSENREKATNIAARTGQVAVWALIVAGPALALTGNVTLGLGMALAGLLVVHSTGKGYLNSVRREETSTDFLE